MHEAMYYNKIIQENIEKLKINGVKFLEPRIEQGKAKLITANELLQYVQDSQIGKSDKKLVGMSVLITAGSTVEYIDPIRVIMNMSSGKMGMSLAKEAHARGASVTVVYGHGSVDPGTNPHVPNIEIRRVNTAQEMFELVMSELTEKRFDVVILTSATSDFSIAKRWNNKIDSSQDKVEITLVPINKIISNVKKVCKHDVFLIGFKAELPGWRGPNSVYCHASRRCLQLGKVMCSCCPGPVGGHNFVCPSCVVPGCPRLG
jgi:phosphopantothenoylcysteine decarboxylase/phosphopantothenate--cysteine ligase